MAYKLYFGIIALSFATLFYLVLEWDIFKAKNDVEFENVSNVDKDGTVDVVLDEEVEILMTNIEKDTSV